MLKDESLKKYLDEYFLDGNTDSYYLFLKDIDVYIKKILFRKIANKELLEDTSQEILIGLHKSLNSFDRTKPIIPWLNSIIFHKTIDFYRKQSKLSVLEQIENHEVENGKMNLDDKVVINEVLSFLSGEVFGSEYLQQKIMGLSIDKISENLGLTKSNTKIIFHRLTNKIKRKFDE